MNVLNIKYWKKVFFIQLILCCFITALGMRAWAMRAVVWPYAIYHLYDKDGTQDEPIYLKLNEEGQPERIEGLPAASGITYEPKTKTISINNYVCSRAGTVISIFDVDDGTYHLNISGNCVLRYSGPGPDELHSAIESTADCLSIDGSGTLTVEGFYKAIDSTVVFISPGGNVESGHSDREPERNITISGIHLVTDSIITNCGGLLTIDGATIQAKCQIAPNAWGLGTSNGRETQYGLRIQKSELEISGFRTPICGDRMLISGNIYGGQKGAEYQITSASMPEMKDIEVDGNRYQFIENGWFEFKEPYLKITTKDLGLAPEKKGSVSEQQHEESTTEKKTGEKKIIAAKKANPMAVKAKTVRISAKALKRKNISVKANKAFAVKKAKGKVTYKKISGSRKITVSKAGKITVKKKTKKGTYKIKVKITASGNKIYKAKSRKITLAVVVK